MVLFRFVILNELLLRSEGSGRAARRVVDVGRHKIRAFGSLPYQTAPSAVRAFDMVPGGCYRQPFHTKCVSDSSTRLPGS